MSLTMVVILLLVASKLGKEKFSNVRVYIGSYCLKGTKKHKISGNKHTWRCTRRSIASGGTPGMRKF